LIEKNLEDMPQGKRRDETKDRLVQIEQGSAIFIFENNVE